MLSLASCSDDDNEDATSAQNDPYGLTNGYWINIDAENSVKDAIESGDLNWISGGNCYTFDGNGQVVCRSFRIDRSNNLGRGDKLIYTKTINGIPTYYILDGEVAAETYSYQISGGYIHWGETYLTIKNNNLHDEIYGLNYRKIPFQNQEQPQGEDSRKYTYEDIKGIWVNSEQHYVTSATIKQLSNFTIYKESFFDIFDDPYMQMSGYHFRNAKDVSSIMYSLEEVHRDNMHVYKKFYTINNEPLYYEERYGRYDTREYTIEGDYIDIGRNNTLRIINNGTNMIDEAGITYVRIYQ